jgi:hypothetical protein
MLQDGSLTLENMKAALGEDVPDSSLLPYMESASDLNTALDAYLTDSSSLDSKSAASAAHSRPLQYSIYEAVVNSPTLGIVVENMLEVRI